MCDGGVISRVAGAFGARRIAGMCGRTSVRLPGMVVGGAVPPISRTASAVGSGAGF